MNFGERTEYVSAPAEDSLRRERRQFPIEQTVHYQCAKGRTPVVGVGKTFEISSQEVHFTTQHTLQQGEKVRLAVDWPAMLDNACRMKLEIFGRVIRAERGTAVVKIERYEFRTRGLLLRLGHSTADSEPATPPPARRRIRADR